MRARSSAEPPNSIKTTASRDHGAGVGAENMHAEHAIGRGVGQNFDEAFGGAVRLGAAIGGEGELADLVGDPGLFQLFLGLADGGHFRCGVDHGGIAP